MMASRLSCCKGNVTLIVVVYKSITAYPQSFIDIIVTCEYPRLFDSYFHSLDLSSPELTKMP